MAGHLLTDVIRLAMIQYFIQMSGGLDQLFYSVLEEVPNGTFVCDLARDAGLASSYALDQLSEIRFAFLDDGTSSAYDLFRIDQASGEMVTSQRIDREAMCADKIACDLSLDIQLMPSQFFKIIKVQITILDINDNVPAFTERHILESLAESSQPGTKISLPTATDPDSPAFSVHRYELAGGEGVFTLSDTNSSDGVQLVLVSSLDRETRDAYDMNLLAIDGGNPPQNGTLNISIRVLDVNDNSPQFDRSSYDVTVAENLASMSKILDVHATDPDMGENGEVRYDLSSKTRQLYGDTFIIDHLSGTVTLAGRLDYEQRQQYVLYITARDRGQDSVATLAKVTINVTDVNDHSPNIEIKTKMTDGRLAVAENARNNSFVAHVSVEDLDDGDNGRYACTLDSSNFALVQLYSTDYKIVTCTIFDREAQDEYSFVMTCTDEGEAPLTTSVRMTVMITDVNDEIPTFNPSLYYVEMEEGSDIGRRVVQVRARDNDVGINARLSYSLANDYDGIFSVDAKTGVIICNTIIDKERTGEYNLTVMAKDSGTPQLTGTAVVIVLIQNTEEEKPTFVKDVYYFSVLENQEPGTTIGRVFISGADRFRNTRFTYGISNSSEGFGSYFVIDSLSGYIRTTDVLDREAQSSYYAVVWGEILPPDEVPTKRYAALNITVLDLNDNEPEFVFPPEPVYRLFVDPETTTLGDIIAHLSATDRDSDLNSVCEYRIIKATPAKVVSMDAYNGSLFLQRDPEQVGFQTLSVDVAVFDCGSPRLNATGKLIISFVTTTPRNLSQNMVIVIVISVITIIIASILVVLIVHMIRKRRGLKRRYNWIPRVIDHKISTVEETVPSAGYQGDCINADMKSNIVIYSTDSGQEVIALERQHKENGGGEKSKKDNQSFADISYIEDDSGCGSAVSGTTTPPESGSTPHWTDSCLQRPASCNKGSSDPNLLTRASEIPLAFRLASRVHQSDSQRVGSTLDITEEGASRGENLQTGGPGSLPRPRGVSADKSRPPRQTQVRFLLPPDVSSLTSSESLERVHEDQA